MLVPTSCTMPGKYPELAFYPQTIK